MDNCLEYRVVADFIRTGRTVAPLQTSDLIPDVMSGFERLIHEPQEVRRAHCIDRSRFEDPEQGADDGLISRRSETNGANGDVYDEKYFFHVKESLPLLLRDRGLYSRDPSWIDACMELHERATLLLLEFARAFDAEYPGAHLFERVWAKDAMSQNTLRLLWYARPKKDGRNVVGSAHVDRDTLTFHIADSRPGLYLQTDPESLQFDRPYEVKEDKTLVFPGAKFPPLVPDTTSRYLANPLYHEIRDRASEEATPRWAIVFFAHTNTVLDPRYAKSRKLMAPMACSA
jgi:hypothetical protein